MKTYYPPNSSDRFVPNPVIMFPYKPATVVDQQLTGSLSFQSAFKYPWSQTAVLSFAGNVVKRTFRAIAGAFSFSTLAAKIPRKSLSGAISFPSGGLASLSSGLRVYYKLENVSDSGPSGLTLTNTNGVTFGAGKVKNAATFVSTSTQFLSRSSNAALDPGTGDFSISMWVKFTSTTVAKSFLGYGSSTTGYGCRIDTGGTISVWLADGTNTQFIGAVNSFNDNNWHLVIGTFDRDGNAVCYVDNNTEDTKSISTVSGSIGGLAFRIGALGAGTNLLDGSVDELGLWDRLLTTEERTDIWNAGTGRTYPFEGDNLLKRTNKILSAALSFAGNILNSTSRLFAATLSFIGSLTAEQPGQVFFSSLSGTLNFSGSITKLTQKLLTAASVAFIGAQTKSTTTTKSASLSFTGATSKRTSTERSGTISFIGSLVTGQFIQRLFTGALSFSGAIAKRVSHQATAALSFVGAIAKRITRLLASTVSFIGTLADRISRILSATINFIGAITRRANTTKTASLSFSGATTKRPTHTFVGALGFAGAMTKRIGKLLSGSVSFVGAQTKRISKLLASILSFVGELNSAAAGHFFQSLSAALSFSGALTRRTSYHLSSALSFVGQLFKRLPPRSLTGSLSFTGSFTKRPNKLLSGVLSFVGAITRSVRYHLSGALSFAGVCLKQIPRIFTASLPSSGALIKQTNKLLAGILSFIGDLSLGNVTYSRTFLATLDFVGTLQKSIATQFASLVSFIVDFTAFIPSAFDITFTASLNFAGFLTSRIPEIIHISLQSVTQTIKIGVTSAIQTIKIAVTDAINIFRIH